MIVGSVPRIWIYIYGVSEVDQWNLFFGRKCLSKRTSLLGKYRKCSCNILGDKLVVDLDYLYFTYTSSLIFGSQHKPSGLAL